MKTVGNFVCSGSLLVAVLGLGCSPAMPGLDAALELRAVAPAAGPTAGGFELSLDGDNFEIGARVTVGGVEAEQVAVTSPTHLTAILPASPGSWGPVSLTVTNPDGQIATRSDLFAYYASQPDFTGTVFSGGRAAGPVIVSDFDRDQTPDIVVVNQGSNSVDLFLGNGIGGISAASSVGAGFLGATLEGGTAGDFNGDGNMDLAVTLNRDYVSVLLGDGRGRLGAPNYAGASDAPNQLAAADFNGDKKLDLVVTNRTRGRDNVSVLFGDGRGGFAPPITWAVGASPGGVVVGDFNGDQNMDFAVADSENKIHVVIGDGKGGFIDQVTSVGPQNHPTMLAVGDFNRDRRLDLAATSVIDDDVMILLGNGLGGFGAPDTFPTGDAPNSLTVGDVNGDQLEDLAITNGGSGSVSVLLGNGRGVFSTATILPVSANPQGVAVGDFNGDRKLDLVVSSGSYAASDVNSPSIWLNHSK